MTAPNSRDLIPFAGGWEAHKQRHCIWIVSPPGYEHELVFCEVAEALEEAFSELGGAAPLVRHPSQWNGRLPIVLGGNLLGLAGVRELPPGSIIYNLEQVVPGGDWMRADYLGFLSRYAVLDYNPRNLARLHRIGIGHAALLEIGYSPVLSRIPRAAEKDIDVLFYGSSNERRTEVLQAISNTGLQVTMCIGVYGEERDRYIARSKIVLNMHYRDNNVFEVVRVSYLFANRVCVVSEGRPDDPDLEWALGGLELAPLAEIAGRCVSLAADPERREALGRAGFERIASRRQSDLLRRCIERASAG